MLLDSLLSNLAVHVEPFALCQVSTGWRLWLPGPPGAMLHFVLRGRGMVRSRSGEVRALSASWLAVVPPGARHALEAGNAIRNVRRIDTPPANPLDRIVAGSAGEAQMVVACGVAHVRYGQALGLFDHLRDVLAVDLSGSRQVLEAFRGILSEQSQAVPGSGAMTGALMTQCLVHLFRRLSAEGVRALPWLMALEDRRQAAAIDAILADPSAPHSVASLAEASAMSRSAFAQRFTVAFGRSPMAFLHHVRMQRSVDLLRAGASSVEEVSTRVGFASRSHFSRAFKKHTGVPPLLFRQAPHAAAALGPPGTGGRDGTGP